MNPYPLLQRVPRFLYLLAAIVLYLLLLWMGGHEATVEHLPGRTDYSKVYHVVFYGGWCCLIWMAMRNPAVPIVVALTMLAGAGDEFHQYFLPFREARISDVLIDTGAGLVAALAMRALQRYADPQPRRSEA
jgi:VanZ family protein